MFYTNFLKKKVTKILRPGNDFLSHWYFYLLSLPVDNILSSLSIWPEKQMLMSIYTVFVNISLSSDLRTRNFIFKIELNFYQ